MPLQRRPSKNLRKFEEEANRQGYRHIAGIDEVGRGCLAGPVVAACVMLPWQEEFDGVNDSKQLTPSQRERLFDIIQTRAKVVGVGLVGPEEIDRMNILRASLKAMRLAVEAMVVKPDILLVDGNQTVPLLPVLQWRIPKGDALSLSVAAASIVAKVTRDRLMVDLGRQFPGFGFEKHKGYGTPEHWQALEKHGPTAIHRESFLKNRFTLFGIS